VSRPYRVEGSKTVEGVHVYVDKPAGKEDADLEDLGEALRELDNVSDVHVDASGNVVAVSYEGGKAGREAIERAVEEAGYGVSRLSVRSEFEEGQGRGLWDI
jgi:copper chaperone CopZ